MRKRYSGLYAPNCLRDYEDPLRQLTPLEVEMVEDGRRIFAERPDLLRIWSFEPSLDEIPGPSFPDRLYNVPRTDIWIIDPFVRGRPHLHSRETLKTGFASIAIRRGVLFDSNMYDLIADFVEHPADLPDHRFKACAKLINSLIARQYDFQFIAYSLEQMTKNTFQSASKYARRITRCILRLHTMDKDVFAATSQIVPDPDLLDSYEDEFESRNLDDIVSQQLKPLEYFDQQKPLAVKLIEACIIKMVLIHRFDHPKRKIEFKLQAFDEFLFNDLNAVLATMRIIAMFYFVGFLDDFIRANLKSRLDKQVKLIESCAWDLHLAALSIRLLADGEEPIADLYSFCTRDTALVKALSTFAVQQVMVVKQNYFPGLIIDNTAFENAFGDDGARLLKQSEVRIASYLQKRTPHLPDVETKIDLLKTRLTKLLS